MKTVILVRSRPNNNNFRYRCKSNLKLLLPLNIYFEAKTYKNKCWTGALPSTRWEAYKIYLQQPVRDRERHGNGRKRTKRKREHAKRDLHAEKKLKIGVLYVPMYVKKYACMQ